jgi:hypothetical protein
MYTHKSLKSQACCWKKMNLRTEVTSRRNAVGHINCVPAANLLDIKHVCTLKLQ